MSKRRCDPNAVKEKGKFRSYGSPCALKAIAHYIAHLIGGQIYG
jgi:hypothetical protein